MNLDTISEAVLWVYNGNKEGCGCMRVPAEEQPGEVSNEPDIEFDENGIPLGIDVQIFQF